MNVVDHFSASNLVIINICHLRYVENIKHVVWNPTTILKGKFCSSNVHTFVELHGIGIDNFAVN